MDCRRQQSHVAVKTSSRVFGVSTIASASNLALDREEFSGRVVITSTTTASASARGSPECDDCQETTDFFSCLSWSKLDVDFCQRPMCRRPRMLHVNVRGGAWKYRAGRPSQWVLGRSLRLPFHLLSHASHSASHQRHRDDFA